MSLRASVTSELVFEDCRIPAENLLPKSGGLRSPLGCLDKARYGIAWGAIGSAMACYEASVQYQRSAPSSISRSAPSNSFSGSSPSCSPRLRRHS